MAYDTIEPSGNVEPTYMLALLCSTVVNTVQAIFAKKGSRSKPITPDMFIPKWAEASAAVKEEHDVEQTPEEQKAALLSIAKMFGSKAKPKSKSTPTKRKKG